MVVTFIKKRAVVDGVSSLAHSSADLPPYRGCDKEKHNNPDAAHNRLIYNVKTVMSIRRVREPLVYIGSLSRAIQGFQGAKGLSEVLENFFRFCRILMCRRFEVSHPRSMR